MTGRPPALQDVDDLDPRPLPLQDILASGRAIRRRRRSAVAALAAVAAVVLGGGVWATGQSESGDVATDPAVAERARGPAAVSLSVLVEVSYPTAHDPYVRGEARWDAASRTLTYESRDDYGSSCPPIGSATATGQRVSLVLEQDTSFDACTADAVLMNVTISGLTTAPTELVATENGVAATTPVVVPTAPRGPETAAGAAATAFVAFALGSTSEVPWAESVRFTIAGTPVSRLSRREAGARTAWVGCPAPPYGARGVYEGRDCPVSPLDTILGAEQDGPVAVEDQRPDVFGCNYYRDESDSPGPTVWIRPLVASRSCFSDFAISVTVDESGEIVHVDLALSGP